ncbi:MAG TPA: hypothetical protein VFD90_01320 [Gaiellales bacterium]|jgi:hypothetical protein|nr:hypothetical protein [Gaiellales bacterium]
MRSLGLLVAFLLGVTLFLVPTAGALGADPANTATVALSSNAAGATRVVLTLSLHAELQCGRLMGPAAVITFPRRFRVPGAIAAGSVLVGTRAARGVAVAGHVVTIAMPIPRGVICQSIGPGVAKVVFARSAGLGNPSVPGTYTVGLRHGGERFAAPVRIR